MKNVIGFLGIALLSGCVTTTTLKDTYDNPGWPGYITSTVSEFDNKHDISMEPAYLGDATSLFRLGARWSDRFADGKYVLVAEWGGAKNFDPDSSLGVNIDGEITYLQPVDSSQYGVVSEKSVISKGLMDVAVEMGNQTHKQYWVSGQILGKMINAQKVVVRVELLDTYWEERLEPTSDALPTYNKYPYIWAKAGFKKFIANVKSI
ncbi:hypothetical protein VIBNISFn27_250006 [Vibrio nigripulchritudo SFn27]|uniref:Lipoprotein n=1 Tax=Vibrio nigripulchritudo TaxID=28173 RepID=U4KFC9_9VIBR|nr:hypothetical protein [Vibrio nigripulchritudo]CCN80770.1 hypothetical protein VIBNIBLFn1_1100006 [Vibrio nigripulchritudo BLFn1]CCN88170.1 hypothetical protein VIBNISFn27_250006 [Vibrio nigripulchritudo SFn27]CCN93669.1 hypothetical protein VIBNIENn2_280002 [Vibrio nigripulchritudo ENn2]CCO43542.1 hypothetical protein VIBNISFn135_970002 [Vibrio nigripulchritudo SFn135]CCO53363.1 hypothetical protein VIBNIWn13_480006 [Vibrio nigripulchritudo Wn13]